MTRKIYTVTLSRWTSERMGDRWSLMHDGEPVVTRGTEAEAIATASYYGWTVEDETAAQPAPRPAGEED